ncbi:MAG: DUF2760 domain-containing protein [Thermoguttaceae bacterium]|jgi:hypothetical protein
MGFGVAFRAFWAALFRRDASRRIELALRSESETPKLGCPSTEETLLLASEDDETRRSGAPEETRSEALELLAALQRDARFIDFIKEDLGDCDDATLGAAARMVHDRCAETLERFFEIRPLSPNPEGTSTTIKPDAQNPARTIVSGGDASSRGTAIACRVVHAGWVAEKCEPPRWSGRAEDSMILAPIELEVE